MNDKRRHTDRFVGFREPAYTQVPDEFFDQFLSVLNGAELRVFLYICRRTLGFKKRVDMVSIQQICGGITRTSGEPLDSGTGLKRTSVHAALKSLVERGLINKEQQFRADGQQGYSAYSLNFQVSQEITWGGSATVDPPYPAERTLPIRHTEHHQETVISRDSKIRSDQKDHTGQQDLTKIAECLSHFGLGIPPERVVSSVYKAGASHNANVFQIAAFLYDRLKFISSKPQYRPQKWAWFAGVVRNHFKEVQKQRQDLAEHLLEGHSHPVDLVGPVSMPDVSGGLREAERRHGCSIIELPGKNPVTGAGPYSAADIMSNVLETIIGSGTDDVPTTRDKQIHASDASELEMA